MYRKLLALSIATHTMFTVDLRSGAVEEVYADTGAKPDGVQIVDGVVYWTTMGEPTPVPGRTGEDGLDFTARNGGIHRIGVDGTDRRDLTRPGDVTTAKQLAVSGGWVYWSDREGARVSRCRTDGSGLEALVVTGAGIENQCVGVAVDPVDEFVYWTQKGPSNGGVGKILRAPIATPEGETPEGRTDIETLWDGLPEPIDLEIVDRTLYWSDRGAPPRGNTLNRAPLPAPGARGGEPEILADGFSEVIGLLVDESAGVAYGSDLAGHIYRVELPPASGPVIPNKTLVADLGTLVSGIAGIV